MVEEDPPERAQGEPSCQRGRSKATVDLKAFRCLGMQQEVDGEAVVEKLRGHVHPLLKRLLKIADTKTPSLVKGVARLY